MSMPSFHTTPKEVECAALLSDICMCMGVSDRVSVISQCACREIYFKNPCIRLFNHVFCYRRFLSKIFEKGSATIYGPYPLKRSHFLSLTRASRCTPKLSSFFLSFFFSLSFSHSSTRNNSKNKIQMFEHMTFPLSYLLVWLHSMMMLLLLLLSRFSRVRLCATP